MPTTAPTPPMMMRAARSAGVMLMIQRLLMTILQLLADRFQVHSQRPAHG
jgi:hypothetical protein